ncbi:MAG: glutamine amidotransferase, partial [Myxococcota bacterium]|nr:glutamine amidotransferase [Myxococcota bacterium]
KEDPSVDLVSFFILRTHQDFGAGWDSEELSLIAFPYERLFTTDLPTFDLVVLQNFNYEPYFSFRADTLLENLAQYVRDGGALVMIGGDRSFDLAGYANTPLAEVLPVQLGENALMSDETQFRPDLTAAGRMHPITRLSGSSDESLAAWERLPAMDGLNLTGSAMPGASVLLTHPLLRVGDEPRPVLAVREVEKGRTMALTVDSSWRWSFSEAGTGRGNQAYLRFWKNAMRWLVADPDDRRVVVQPSRENVLLGERVRLVVKVRDADFEPVEGARVEGFIKGPDGEVESFEAVTDGSGEASTLVQPETRGAHRVEVQVAEGRGASQGRAETVFGVSTRNPELVEIHPDGAFLQDLATRYGGTYRAPGDLEPPRQDPEAGREVLERNEVKLAAAPWVALLFGGLSSLAWWLRRRAGAR